MHLRELLAGSVLMLIACPLLAADDKKDKDKNKDKPIIAHIKLSGDLDESPPHESVFGNESENLRMKLDRIKKAKKDAHVKALLVQIEGLEFGLFSFGKIDEVRRALLDFRASGKKVYCYTDDVGGLDYLIASACDVICLPPGGSFGLLGLHIEMSFYKDTLDKLDVKADFLTMGEAKGAAEPFTRTSMSPENRKQYNLVLDDFYENGIVKTIVDSRTASKFTADRVKTIIDEGPYTAKKAATLGLIDKIAYFDTMEGMIKQDLKAEPLSIAKNYGKPKKADEDNPLALLAKLMSPPKKSGSKKPKIAVIYAVGAIESGKGGGGILGGGSVGSTTMIEAIQQAEKDDTVKAIVLRVDSPGGSALASDLIWHELKLSKKPVIASMGDVAASGGYYISMGASKVYAEPGTLTGSIGVVGGKIVIGGVFALAGVKTETLARGKNSGSFSTNTPFSPSEKDAITALMRDIYDQFLDNTLENRTAAGVKLTREKLLTLAGGRIWTGRQAKEHGLVDALGTLDDAIADAKQLAKLPMDTEPELLILPEPTSFLDRLIEGKSDSRLEASLLPLIKKVPELRGHLRSLETLLNQRNDKIWLMLPQRFSVK
jgi:protease-4